MTGEGKGPPVESGGPSGAVDRARTGDLDLGKVALYQLSYYRRSVQTNASATASFNVAEPAGGADRGRGTVGPWGRTVATG